MTLPPDISPDFAPTPQTLWAAWGASSEAAVKSGWGEPIWFAWVLASKGETGLAEIQAQMPNSFLAAVAFEDILKAQALMDAVDAPAQRSWMPAWLGGGKNFMLIEEANGIRWAFGHPKTVQGKVLASGKIEDFLTLVRDGQKILDEKLYQKILGDSRPVEPGHPDDWFEMMQSPETWGPVRDLLKQNNE